MDSKQLDKIIQFAIRCLPKEIQNQYRGVFPFDFVEHAKLYKPGKYRLCVLNTQKSTEPGLHWIVLGVDCRNKAQPQEWHAILFDSLASSKINRSLKAYLKQMDGIKYLKTNRFPTQDEFVDDCSLQVVYFIILSLVEKMNFFQIMATFDSENPLRNDCELIQNFTKFLDCSELKLDLNNILKDTFKMCD